MHELMRTSSAHLRRRSRAERPQDDIRDALAGEHVAAHDARLRRGAEQAAVRDAHCHRLHAALRSHAHILHAAWQGSCSACMRAPPWRPPAHCVRRHLVQRDLLADHAAQRVDDGAVRDGRRRVGVAKHLGPRARKVEDRAAVPAVHGDCQPDGGACDAGHARHHPARGWAGAATAPCAPSSIWSSARTVPTSGRPWALENLQSISRTAASALACR